MTADRTIRLTIDDQEYQCQAGCTVYEAATAVGIHIPTFCHHEKLVPVGACRMCLVEIEGARGLQTACTTPVREGMVVRVHTSPAAIAARKANIEFLLTNHPLDCPVCDKGGECPLQNQAMLDGPGKSRYVEEKRHKLKRHPLSELIVIDQERCVLCWRCIRFLDEWAGDHELDLFGRGADTRISTLPGHPLSSKWQGNTIDVCPVGALTSRIFRFEARVWELTNTPSICPLCAVGCNTVLGVKNNQLRRITPRQNVEINDVWICDKGRFGHGFVDHPDRLVVPLIRRDDELEPTTWDEALDEVARRFKQIVEADGPQAIGGLGSTRVTNEANYLFQRFFRTIVGTNNLDHLGRMPAGAMPLKSLSELEHKDTILLMGLDPSTEAPLVELWLKKAILRHGARLLIASPRRIELTRYPGLWLGYRPGSEVALLQGLARAVLDKVGQLPGRDRVSRVTGMDEFRAGLADHTPGRTERKTGVAAGTLQQAVEYLAETKRPAILCGADWTSGQNGADALAAIANLGLLLGGIDVGFVARDSNTLGALEMGMVPDLYPGQQPVRDASARIRGRLASLWGSKLSPVAGLDFDGMMVSAREGRLKALWIMGADPSRDRRPVGVSLGDIPFLVVQDLFMSDAARQADVVLPAASFAETDGSLINLTGRLQLLRAAMRPPGKARADWRIVVEVARRMVEGKHLKAWGFAGPADVWNEVARVVPSYRSVDYDTMGGEGWQGPVPQAEARRSFAQIGASELPCGSEYPLVLAVGRQFYDRGTLLRCTERIQNLVPEPFVVIHPLDARKQDVVDGDSVWVVSAQGRLELSARVGDEVVPGVVYVPLNLGETPLSVLADDPWQGTCVRLEK